MLPGAYEWGAGAAKTLPAMRRASGRQMGRGGPSASRPCASRESVVRSTFRKRFPWHRILVCCLHERFPHYWTLLSNRSNIALSHPNGLWHARPHSASLDPLLLSGSTVDVELSDIAAATRELHQGEISSRIGVSYSRYHDQRCSTYFAPRYGHAFTPSRCSPSVMVAR